MNNEKVLKLFGNDKIDVTPNNIKFVEYGIVEKKYESCFEITEWKVQIFIIDNNSLRNNN